MTNYSKEFYEKKTIFNSNNETKSQSIIQDNQKVKLNIFVILSTLQPLVGGEAVPFLGRLDDDLLPSEELFLPTALLDSEGRAINHT